MHKPQQIDAEYQYVDDAQRYELLYVLIFSPTKPLHLYLSFNRDDAWQNTMTLAKRHFPCPRFDPIPTGRDLKQQIEMQNHSGRSELKSTR